MMHRGAEDPRSSSHPLQGSLPWALLGANDSAALDGRRLSREEIDRLLGAIEDHVQASRSGCFTFAPDGTATLHAKDRAYHAGRFEVPTLAMLRERARALPRTQPGHVRLSILRGQHPLTDIGTLQATAPAGTLFQVASQFNCLEAPGRRIVPVRHYLHDSTQGPRASVSAFPGTFLRHYCAPRATGHRFVQTDSDDINLLADVIPPNAARVQSGYLLADQIADPRALARALEDRFDQMRVGVHDDVEVVLGHNWGGPVPNAPHQRVAQAFTSTIALGMYSADDGSAAFATIRRQLLRAAYLGTLLGAVTLGKRTVVLTLIGGGVFGNPHLDIWDAIHWAIAQTEPYVANVLDVIVNVRTDHVEPADADQVFARGGACIDIADGELRIRTKA